MTNHPSASESGELNNGMHDSIFVKVWGDAGGGDAGRRALAQYAFDLGRATQPVSAPIAGDALPKWLDHKLFAWASAVVSGDAGHKEEMRQAMIAGILHFRDEARAALANQPAPPVPANCVIVPTVPTDAMCIAAREKIGIGSNVADHVYRAMIAAHQPAQEQAFPERDQSKPAEQQGLFHKFDVQRTDGSDQPGGKHHGCRYYVLDLDHDQHAPAAMRAYAAAARSTHPQLAADIEAEFGAAQQEPVAAPQQAAAPRTDLSKRIREAATADVTLAQAKLLIGAAEEIERWAAQHEAGDELKQFENYFCMTLSCDDSEPAELVEAARVAACDAWMERARRAAASPVVRAQSEESEPMSPAEAATLIAKYEGFRQAHAGAEEQDAARYRWLRENWVSWGKDGRANAALFRTRKKLDESIDAAIRAAQEGEDHAR